MDPNPDTTPILAGSHALAPNTNTEDELAALNPPLPGGHPDGHGTYMAMIAAAPANGWGMVGLAPTSVRVYNLKALAAGQTTFGFVMYSKSINYCQELGDSIPIAVVDLSLVSHAQPTESEREALSNSVLSANAHDLGVVAAVGDEGGPVQALDYQQDVLGVGASDANPANLGAMCPFTNRGVGLTVLAPGCGSQTEPDGGSGIEIAFSDDGAPAWAEGTSEAASIVSAAEASIRAYSPTLTFSQVQGCITSTLANEGNLDVAAAFDACGLGQIVSEGMAAYRAANGAPPSRATRVRPQRPCSRRSRRSSRGRGSPGSRSSTTSSGSPSPASQGSAFTTGRAGARRAGKARHARAEDHRAQDEHAALGAVGIGSWRGSSPGVSSSRR